MSRYFDRQGQPMSDVFAWARLFEDRAYQVVQQTTLADGTLVSTVWLGLNHQYGDGPPLIFETMVFPASGADRDQERYSTEADAWVGHAKMVNKWTRLPPPLGAEACDGCGGPLDPVNPFLAGAVRVTLGRCCPGCQQGRETQTGQPMDKEETYVIPQEPPGSESGTSARCRTRTPADPTDL